MTQMVLNNFNAASSLFLGPPEVPHYRMKLARRINAEIKNLGDSDFTKADLLRLVDYFNTTLHKPSHSLFRHSEQKNI